MHLRKDLEFLRDWVEAKHPDIGAHRIYQDMDTDEYGEDEDP